MKSTIKNYSLDCGCELWFYVGDERFCERNWCYWHDR